MKLLLILEELVGYLQNSSSFSLFEARNDLGLS